MWTDAVGGWMRMQKRKIAWDCKRQRCRVAGGRSDRGLLQRGSRLHLVAAHLIAHPLGLSLWLDWSLPDGCAGT